MTSRAPRRNIKECKLTNTSMQQYTDWDLFSKLKMKMRRYTVYYPVERSSSRRVRSSGLGLNDWFPMPNHPENV